MSPLQATIAIAAPNADHGAAYVGVGAVTLVVLAVLGAVIWGALRLRSVKPVLNKGVSGIREELFAAEVMRDFLPNVKRDPATTQGLVPEPTPGPATGSMDGPGLADEGTSVGALEGFYANTLTSKPVKAAGPATGTLTSGNPRPETRPELAGVFGDSVREFVEAIRSLATAVEQAALVGGGSDLDRASRSVEAFTTGLGALPLKDVLLSAGSAERVVDAGLTGRGDPQERLTTTV